MKKLLFLLLLVTFASCSKDDEPKNMTFKEVIGAYQFEHLEFGTQTFELYLDEYNQPRLRFKGYTFLHLSHADEYSIELNGGSIPVTIRVFKHLQTLELSGSIILEEFDWWPGFEGYYNIIKTE